MTPEMRARVAMSKVDTTLFGSDEDRAFALRMRDLPPSEWIRRMERLWTDRLMAKGYERFPEPIRLAVCDAWKTIKEAASEAGDS